jgi:hypothetical protein
VSASDAADEMHGRDPVRRLASTFRLVGAAWDLVTSSQPRSRASVTSRP